VPKITNDNFYPIVASCGGSDYLVIVQGGIVKKANAAAVAGAPASVMTEDGNTTITLTALGGVLVVDNAVAVNVYLPSVGAGDIGRTMEVYRIGAGAVTIHAADADVINDSAAGGSVASTRANQTDAAIVLRLIQETRYAISSVIGSWSTA